MRIFLNSYHPLCETRRGQEIIQESGLPPFIDAPIRREPDFECEYPSVSGLCRLDKLVDGPRWLAVASCSRNASAVKWRFV
jgi:hypothetical protein